jgi:hypothetical protein
MNMRVDLCFPHDYEIDPDAELPGTPGRTRQIYYPGASESGGSNGIMVKLMPHEGKPWIGFFQCGGLGWLNGVFSCPDARTVCVVSGGAGYFVCVDDPNVWGEPSCTPIIDVQPVLHHDLIVFATPTELCAYGKQGRVWTTQRLSFDGINITSITDRTMRGTGWDAMLQRDVEFTVDLLTGQHDGGASPDDYASR